jgi:formylglycine-generating enzyme required for sulfatase activity
MVLAVKPGLAALTAGTALAGGAVGLIFTRPQAAPFAEVQVRMFAGHKLSISQDEISTTLWNRCHLASSCALSFPASITATPATGVNADDIAEFTAWLNASTKSQWRLPTIMEQRAYSKDLPRKTAKPLFSDPRMAWAADYHMAKPYARDVYESGHFGALPNGLRDIGGNVWEWTSSCVNPIAKISMCPAFYVGGDHEAEIPVFLRDAYTEGCSAGLPPTHLGFRLVRDV